MAIDAGELYNMTTILLKRGLKANIPASASLGEPWYCTDTGELYIGQGNGIPLKRIGILIDDSNTNTLNTWSSSKINNLLGTKANISDRGLVGSDVLAKNTSTQSITGGNITKVTFPTEVTDRNNELSNSTFTSKAVQTVLVSATISISSSIANNVYFYMYIYKNGSQFTRIFEITAGNAACCHVSFPVDLNVNDTIEIYCQHTNGSNNRNLDGNQFLSIKQLY